VELYKQAVAIDFFQQADADGGWSESGRVERLGDLLDDLLDDRDYRRERAGDVREILRRAEPALKLCRQARGLAGVDWKLDFSGPAIEVVLPDLGDHRRLAEVLCLAALAAHEAGDDAAAVEYLRDGMALGRSFHAMQTLVGHLVGLGIVAQVCTAAEQMGPTLTVGSASRAASREGVRRLAAELLDLEPARRGLARAMIGERGMIYDTVERLKRGELTASGIASGGSTGRPAAWKRLGARLFLKRFFNEDEVRMLRYMTRYIDAARCESFPAARARTPVLKIPRSPLQRAKYMLSAILLPSFDKVYVLQYRGIAMRRMTATALAIRLYEIDRGHRPEKLTDLVPKYLAAVPVDPFTAQREPIRYVRQAEKPLLYSAHENGRDDGGDFALDDGVVNGRRSLDWAFFLNGDRPTSRPDRGHEGVLSDVELPAPGPESRPARGDPNGCEQ
jgi:hypothetical protein